VAGATGRVGMFEVDDAVLGDAGRLAAVSRARRALPAQAVPLQAIARLAGRLLRAPMAVVTLVSDEEEFFFGSDGLPPALSAGGRASLEYSVCKYIVCRDYPVACADMINEDGGRLSRHLLAAQYGVRAFLGVPVRDTDDHPIGSLTVMDRAARPWTDDEVALLLHVVELLRVPGGGPPAGAVATLDSTALLDSVQEAFLAVNPDGMVVGFNRAAQRLLGFPASEVCGRHLDDSLLPDYDGQPIGVALNRLFAAAPARPVLLDVKVRHRDGRRLPVTASLSVIRGAAGALACAFLVDQSDRAAVEAIAQRRSVFLAALLDNLTVGVIACDDEGRVRVLNRVLRDAQGIGAGDPIPEDYPASVAGFLHDDALRPMPWEQTPLMRARRGEHVDAVDVLIDAPADQIRTYTTTARPIVAADGRRLGAVAVAHEVTAMRRAERFRDCHLAVQELLASADSLTAVTAEILRLVATALRWPCAELFLIDDTTGTLRPAGHWARDEIDPPGTDFFDHIPVRGFGVTGRVWQSGRAMWVPDIDADPALNTSWEQSRVQACVRNGIRTVLAVPVRNGNLLLGVLTCYAGIPEQHEELLTVLLDGVAAQIGVYVALRRAENLARQLSHAQEDFLALLGHELRTPLTSIGANTAMLSEDAGAFDPEHRQMIRAVERNTAALQKTVATLFDLAGLESGHIRLRTSPVDLTALVAEALTAARHGAADVGIRLHARLPGRLVVTGDAARLRQIIDDLLANAVNYSPLGGDVHVRLTRRAGTAELSITDHGIGTPPDEIRHVFDRFFRASNVRHQGIHGSGLGLSLARAITSLHGGTIELTANPTAGSTVSVRLPVS